MKRRRMNLNADAGNLPKEISLRSLESSILLESGGDTGVDIKSLSSDISGALGGALRLQYDSSYWNNDFFTTHYENVVVGLLVSVFSNNLETTTVFPVVLPRLSLASTLNGTSEEFLQLQKSVAYGLNLLFSKPGIVVSTFNGPYEYFALGLNDPVMPILQDTKLPPLLWDVIPNTGLLTLRRNPDYVDDFDPLNFDIAFQLISFPPLMTGVQNITAGSIQLAGDKRGWYGEGGYLFGHGSLNTTEHVFQDIYGTDPASYAFLLAKPMFPAPSTPILFQDNVVKLSLEKTMVVGERSLGLCSSRYYKVKSASLSRLQKRPMTSNVSDGDFSQTVGVIYTIPDTKNVYEDLVGPNNENTAPVIHVNPGYNGTNIIDLFTTDEWGNTMNPYNVSEYDLLNRSFYEDGDMAPVFPPAAYIPLDPYGVNNAPNHDCLFPYYKINQTMIQFANTDGSGTRTLKAPSLPTSNPSQGITHFIRVFGS